MHDFAVKLNLVGQLEEAKDAFLDAILAMMPIDNKGNEKDKEALLKSSIDKGEGINSIPIASFIGLISVEETLHPGSITSRALIIYLINLLSPKSDESL